MSGVSELEAAWAPVRSDLEIVLASLERGQAASPLVEALQSACDHKSDLRCLALANTAESRGQLLCWLAGFTDSSLQQVLSTCGALEIEVGSRGFEIRQPGEPQPRRFGSVADLTAALAAMMAGPAQSTDAPVHLLLEGPLTQAGLRIYSPPPALPDSSECLKRLADGQSIMVIATSTKTPWPPELASVLSGMASVAEFVVPVSSEGPGLTPDDRRVLGGATILHPTVVIGDDRSLPAILQAGTRPPVRDRLDMAQRGRRFRSLGEIARERIDSDARQLESRRKREQMLDKASDLQSREQDAKAALEKARQALADDTARLLAAVRDNSRRSVLKSGLLRTASEEISSSLQPDDIDRIKEGRIYRLSLKPEMMKHIHQHIGAALQKQIEDDCALLGDGLDVLRKTIEGLLTAMQAPNRGFPLQGPQPADVWSHLSDMLEVDLRYRGEIPRRGFWSSLGEGRRIVFLILMIGSLVGGYLGLNNFRSLPGVGAVLFLVFAATAVLSVRNWRQAEDQLIGKEILRIRDQIDSLLDRLLDGILREKVNRYQTFLDELKRASGPRLDAISRETQAARAAAADEDKRTIKAKLRTIETRIADVNALSSRLAKLEITMQKLHGQAVALLKASLAEGTKTP